MFLSRATNKQKPSEGKGRRDEMFNQSYHVNMKNVLLATFVGEFSRFYIKTFYLDLKEVS